MSEAKVKFPCSECGREFTWKPEIAGRKARCKCGATIVVPKTRPGSELEDEPQPLEDDFGLAGEGIGGEEDDVAPPPPPPLPSSSFKKPTPGAIGAKAAGALVGDRIGALAGSDSDTWKWWYYVIGGLAMVPVAFYQYFRLMDYEENKETSTGLKNFESVLYGIFGKWGVVMFILCIGGVCIAIGLYKYRKHKEAAA
jgi:DNA-directed RNA polymerase subunit RPC12/RpoP